MLRVRSLKHWISLLRGRLLDAYSKIRLGLAILKTKCVYKVQNHEIHCKIPLNNCTFIRIQKVGYIRVEHRVVNIGSGEG